MSRVIDSIIAYGRDLFGSSLSSASLAGCQPTPPKRREEPAAPVSESASRDAAPANAPNSLFAALQITPVEVHEFDADNTLSWDRRSGANGDPFDCTFQPGNISFSGGILTLALSGQSCAEYRTSNTYGYGYYEVRMQPARGNGLMSGSFFTYTGVYGQPSHHEIDIEALGKDCSIQLNHYGRGRGDHELVLRQGRLGFDPCAGFNNYGFVWRPDSITYYINGREVHRVTSDIPDQPGQIMANIWSGTSTVNGWLGRYQAGQAHAARYDWVRFAPLAAGSAD